MKVSDYENRLGPCAGLYKNLQPEPFEIETAAASQSNCPQTYAVGWLRRFY